MLNNLRQRFAPQWLQLQDQLQANQRLRWMLWGIAYIFIIYFALTLGEWRQPHNDALAQLQRTSAKLDQLQHQTHWAERQQQEQQLADKLRSKLWVAQSESLAEADLQNYARRLMADHNVQNLRLRLAPTEKVQIAGENLFKVTADINGAIGLTEADHLLKSMADNPRLLVIERYSYAPQRAGQLAMLVTAYFLSEAPAAASVPAAGGDNAVR